MQAVITDAQSTIRSGAKGRFIAMQWWIGACKRLVLSNDAKAPEYRNAAPCASVDRRSARRRRALTNATVENSFCRKRAHQYGASTASFREAIFLSQSNSLSWCSAQSYSSDEKLSRDVVFDVFFFTRRLRTWQPVLRVTRG